MADMVSEFLTSIDDFVTSESHTCIWKYYKATYDEPEELTLISVDGMDENCCPKDLWKAASSEYPENMKPLTEYDL